MTDPSHTLNGLGSGQDQGDALIALAARVEAATEPDRELADEVLLACGWRLNHDADEIAAWRLDPGTCEGEDGRDYPVTLADRMNWSCWYKPKNKPFRDDWIDGPYRPDPLSSIDAAMKLVPDGWCHGYRWSAFKANARGACEFIPEPPFRPEELLQVESRKCATPALAITAAALRARATLTLASGAPK